VGNFQTKITRRFIFDLFISRPIVRSRMINLPTAQLRGNDYAYTSNYVDEFRLKLIGNALIAENYQAIDRSTRTNPSLYDDHSLSSLPMPFLNTFTGANRTKGQ